jgi:hypothetical protein
MAESRAESPADRSDKMRHANKQNKKKQKTKREKCQRGGNYKTVRSKDTTCNTKRRRSYFVIVKNFIKVDLQSDAFRVI